jgi:signal transduction histidine kinase
VQTNYNTLKGCLVKIEDYNKQAQEVVNIVLHRSRRESERETNFKTVNIHNILNGCCNKAIREFEQKTPYALHVIKNYDPSIGTIEVIPMDLSRAFSNIIDNSMYALRQKTTHHLEFFEPTLAVQTLNRDHDIEINIEDNGIGMTEAVLKRLFQPFFSTKPLGEGTGLGLALAHDIIVQGHHGTISVLSEKEKFTKLIISLPKIHLTEPWHNE